MIRFILHRMMQSVWTILGVMVLTFLLFRVMAGDIAAVYVGDKGTEQDKATWRQRYGYDRPMLFNIHNRLRITDLTTGEDSLMIRDEEGGELADRLALVPPDTARQSRSIRVGRFIRGMDRDTPIEELTGQWSPKEGPAVFRIDIASGGSILVDAKGITTCGQLLDLINAHPENHKPDGEGKLVKADIAQWSLAGIADCQFVAHFKAAVLFQSRSLKDNQKLSTIIAERAPKSLALTVPAMAIGWLLGMVISCFVAYYRGRMIDKIGVFLSVLGMCVPFLAFMIYGQWLMFRIAPDHAFGLANRVNIYVPVIIMVIAGLGSSVRFYRTVILDEINRDYVRTAKAKGVSLPTILFKHVLKNCMLPILTNLILAIPFLVMGSLLVERYFGIPGLGDLMITSINDRDEPIMSGLVFLSALIYTAGVLITDLSYVVFDPRIRLK